MNRPFFFIGFLSVALLIVQCTPSKTSKKLYKNANPYQIIGMNLNAVDSTLEIQILNKTSIENYYELDCKFSERTVNKDDECSTSDSVLITFGRFTRLIKLKANDVTSHSFGLDEIHPITIEKKAYSVSYINDKFNEIYNDRRLSVDLTLYNDSFYQSQFVFQYKTQEWNIQKYSHKLFRGYINFRKGFQVAIAPYMDSVQFDKPYFHNDSGLVIVNSPIKKPPQFFSE